GAAEADDVQYGAEDLTLEICERLDLDDGRRNVGAMFGDRRQRYLLDLVAEAAHAFDMLVDAVARLGGDDRADIDIEAVGAAERQLLERPFQHGERAVCDIVLQAEHPQRRAALAGAVEGRGDDVADDLFGKRGGIDDHAVLAAGFGDQRDRLAGYREPLGKLC